MLSGATFFHKFFIYYNVIDIEKAFGVELNRFLYQVSEIKSIHGLQKHFSDFVFH